MKKILITLCLAAALTAAAKAPKVSNDTTIVVTLDKETPMHCQNCQNRIADELRFEKGVKNIESSLDTQTVTIRYDKRKNTADNLRAALANLGFTACTQQ